MDYLYENLGDERFQEFCSCLISKEFPNAQVFPIGQPDGGRDTIAYLIDTPKKEFIVFQVKYVRNPFADKDINKWLVNVIEGEIKKIDKLIPKGAKSYYLLTNVKSTGHSEVGSIDKLNKILEDNISIPSMCWWREDISRRFENDPIFKWSFPEILNGQDILNSALFKNINENKERRENIIRAYLADQYEIDNEVKFRQIDLQNGLYALYTDVPIRIKNMDEKNKSLKFAVDLIENKNQLTFKDDFIEQDKIGSATFLLHPQVQKNIKQILLEGGPGQGKSTICQYVCQVHRSRLLNKTSDITLLPDNIKNTPIRLPFKIDLRHIAAWVENKNPYVAIINDDNFKKIWQNSLESFLLGHVIYHSKVNDFTVSDFLSISKLSPILFVFDGFDEIADLNVRQEVIDFINKGINRLSENCNSIQVIITSRPAAFSDSVGFSEDTYPHFELTDITQNNIKEYVEKFVKANRLNSREASEIRRLVKEKLDLPHLRDLAKSPMQLAIFISLLRTDGESLPNKRTALYDSYIRLFFNREAEKNSIIRDYRELIIEIHEYLAWVLHSEAELHKNSGIIHIDDLKKRLNKYLQGEGHQTDITDKLFLVVKERVCALVSRVQGTFEFEVQPLREYFCAKYLYKTKPYSPAGCEKPGTLPDRFDAISHNFYWQNVVRFFAGCFDKGELSMLILKLKELVDDNILKYTNYPRVITSQLLSDYVFKQYPHLFKDVVKIIIDGINIGNIINQEQTSSNNEPIIVPSECGREELVSECFKQLKTFPAIDYASELIGLIKNNSDRNVERWSEYVSQLKNENLTLWLEYAYRLQIIHLVDENILASIDSEDDMLQVRRQLQILIDGNRIDFINKHLNLKSIVFSSILNSKMYVLPKSGTNSVEFLEIMTGNYIFSQIINNENEHLKVIDFLNRYFTYNQRKRINILDFDFEQNDHMDEKIYNYIYSIKHILEYEILQWRRNIEPWDTMIESGRRIFNDCWALDIISVISAGIKSEKERYEEFHNLSDYSISLCKRARCARMKSGNIKYWEGQFANEENLLFKLMVFFTWATPKTIVQLSNTLSTLISKLCKEDYIQLFDGINKACYNSKFSKFQEKYLIIEIEKNSFTELLIFLISSRFDSDNRGQLICNYISSDSDFVEESNDLKLDFLIRKYLSNPSDEIALAEIKSIYSKIKTYNDRIYYFIARQGNIPANVPYEIAKKIMLDCKRYPRVIASVAEKACRINARKYLKPVGEVAKDEKWFAE